MDEPTKNNWSTMKKGLILGRFQPFHLGHLEGTDPFHWRFSLGCHGRWSREFCLPLRKRGDCRQRSIRVFPGRVCRHVFQKSRYSAPKISDTCREILRYLITNPTISLRGLSAYWYPKPFRFVHFMKKKRTFVLEHPKRSVEHLLVAQGFLGDT